MTKTGNGSAEKELKNKIRQIHIIFLQIFMHTTLALRITQMKVKFEKKNKILKTYKCKQINDLYSCITNLNIQVQNKVSESKFNYD